MRTRAFAASVSSLDKYVDPRSHSTLLPDVLTAFSLTRRSFLTTWRGEGVYPWDWGGWLSGDSQPRWIKMALVGL